MPFMNIIDRMGMQKGLLIGIEALLKVRFGAAGQELFPEIQQIHDHILLDKILERLETAESPAALRTYANRIRRNKEKQEAARWGDLTTDIPG
jgi:hypothetical protein